MSSTKPVSDVVTVSITHSACHSLERYKKKSTEYSLTKIFIKPNSMCCLLNEAPNFTSYTLYIHLSAPSGRRSLYSIPRFTSEWRREVQLFNMEKLTLSAPSKGAHLLGERLCRALKLILESFQRPTKAPISGATLEGRRKGRQ